MDQNKVGKGYTVLGTILGRDYEVLRVRCIAPGLMWLTRITVCVLCVLAGMRINVARLREAENSRDRHIEMANRAWRLMLKKDGALRDAEADFKRRRFDMRLEIVRLEEALERAQKNHIAGNRQAEGDGQGDLIW